MTEPSTTRRGLLALAGTATLAGCLDLGSSDEAESIDSHRFREITRGEATPVVVDDRPVEIEADRLTDAADRVTELLGELPLPLGPDEVPNGHIRRRLTDAASEATDGLDAARTAPNRLAALEELRFARGEARYAAAGWAFVDEGVTDADLREDHGTAVERARSTEERLAYRGTDPVDAALVYGLIEELLDRVDDDGPSPGRRERSQLLAVAAWGERVETARTRVDDARYLADRFRASLEDDATAIDDDLVAAVDDLAADLEERREALPPEPTEDITRRTDLLRTRLRRTAEASVDGGTNAPGPASGLLRSTGGLVAFGAHDRLSERLEDGDPLAVESASDVIDARRTAVDAIETAREEAPRAALARPTLADVARSVVVADEELSRYDAGIPSSRLGEVVAHYVSATVRARSVPTACQQVLDALDR